MNSFAIDQARANWAIEIPFFLASSSTRSFSTCWDLCGSASPRDLYPLFSQIVDPVMTQSAYASVSCRLVAAAFHGRVKKPRARGDQGIHPTPYIWLSARPLGQCTTAYLEGRNHFPLFLPVCGIVEVLHTDERG
jgi:hypothetical protein